MCGLAGIFNLNIGAKEEMSRPIVKKMIEAIKHRGPDGRGFYFDSKIGLGFCRLAITDSSVNAGQPMANEDGSIIFACNGEIYNFKELKAGLLKRGHSFKSQSDSEVIGHLYEEFGLDFARKLNGMFAVVIWDIKKERFILARDRFGIKPLYYSIINNKIVFGSEIKALLKHPAVRKVLDLESMDFYFSFQGVPPDRSLFKGIFPVLPGGILFVIGGKVKSQKYWSPSATQIFHRSLSLREARTRLLNLLRHSTVYYFQTDFPVGLFLSGGNDSAGLLALARLIYPKKAIHTFTLGIRLEDGSLANRVDFEVARRLAKIFKTRHHEDVISSRDFVENFEIISAACDEPFPLSSSLYFFVSKLARRYVKIAISGDGGDELFGGYHYHEKIISSLLPENHFYARLYSVFSREEKEKLYAETSLRKQIGTFQNFLEKFFGQPRLKDKINRILTVDLALRLSQYGLKPLDVFSMRHSLEVRAPYLDNLLVDFILGLPGEMKIRKGVRKFILKEALKELLPPEVLNLEKSPFQMPKKYFFSPPFFNKYVKPALSSRHFKNAGLFNMRFVSALLNDCERLFSEKASSPNYKLTQLWTLFCFQYWWEGHFK